MCLTQQQLHHPMAILLKPVLLLLVEPRRLSAQQMDQMIARALPAVLKLGNPSHRGPQGHARGKG